MCFGISNIEQDTYVFYIIAQLNHTSYQLWTWAFNIVLLCSANGVWIIGNNLHQI